MTKNLIGLFALGIAMLAPTAKADLLYTSSVGTCCFTVNLHQDSGNTTDVVVTVSLISGAQYFANTGSGNHPGFAANISDLAHVSITSISSPWTLAGVHASNAVTNGPDVGTFTFYIDNPGSGASAHNPGPLVFTVHDGNGINFSSFVTNTSGYYFAADIMNAAGATGEGAINTGGCTVGTPNCGSVPNVPEPSSVVLLSTAGLGVLWAMRRRFVRSN